MKLIFNFHKSNLPFAVLIRFFTRTKQFNHVSIELDNITYEAKMSPFRGLTKNFYKYQGTDNFFNWKKNQKLVFKEELVLTQNEYIKIKRYLDTNVTYKYKKILGINFKLPKIGYDYKSILGFIKNTDYQDNNAFNCSEFAYFILNHFIIKNKINMSTNLSPNDFLFILQSFKIGKEYEKNTKQ
jgi:hypothetical protein